MAASAQARPSSATRPVRRATWSRVLRFREIGLPRVPRPWPMATASVKPAPRTWRLDCREYRDPGRWQPHPSNQHRAHGDWIAESTETLADGNRIRQTSTAHMEIGLPRVPRPWPMATASVKPAPRTWRLDCREYRDPGRWQPHPSNQHRAHGDWIAESTETLADGNRIRQTSTAH